MKPILAGLPCILAAALLVAGCTRPAVAPKPIASQESAGTLKDFDRAAGRIAAGMQSAGLLGPAAPGGDWYIHVVAEGSAFLASLRDALAGEILARGGRVALRPAGASVVNLDLDWVRWGGMGHTPQGAGTLAGATAGLALILADAGSITTLEAAAAAAALGVAADLLRSVTPTHGAEIAWRATVLQGDRLAWQARETMYVHTADLPLFQVGTRQAALPSPAPGYALVAQPLRFVR